MREKPVSRSKSIRVSLERDEHGWWVAETRDLGPQRGCASQGRTLAQVRERFREALSLYLGEAAAARVELVERLKLPGRVSNVVGRAQKARARAQAASSAAAEETKAAAEALVGLGVSVRDAGDLLGITGARVQQLVAE